MLKIIISALVVISSFSACKSKSGKSAGQSQTESNKKVDTSTKVGTADPGKVPETPSPGKSPSTADAGAAPAWCTKLSAAAKWENKKCTFENNVIEIKDFPSTVPNVDVRLVLSDWEVALVDNVTAAQAGKKSWVVKVKMKNISAAPITLNAVVSAAVTPVAGATNCNIGSPRILGDPARTIAPNEVVQLSAQNEACNPERFVWGTGSRANVLLVAQDGDKAGTSAFAGPQALNWPK